MKYLIYIFSIVFAFSIKAQDREAYKFLSLPITVESGAAGSHNHSLFTKNLSHSFHNPALLRSEMADQLHFSFNSYFTGVKQMYVQTAWNSKKTDWVIAPSLVYFNHGTVDQTDIFQNFYGTTNANDWLLQVAASKKYLSHWNYGIQVKYIHSKIAHYNSNAIAADLGLNYQDTLVGIQAALVLKNIGTIINQYSPQDDQILPFDVQLGVSYKFSKLPLQLSLNTLRFPLIDRYQLNQQKTTLNTVMRRLILHAEWNIKNIIHVNLGYHYARRQDWSISENGNGILGWSTGLSFYHPKFQIFYSLTPMQQHSWQQFGIAFNTKKKSIF